MAARAARAVEGTGARVLDTRKTTPGLRALEKAAVAAGGAHNHRVGLYDAILIKENHIAAAGGIAQAIALARAAAPELAATLEVEVRNPEEIEQALAAGAPRLLLDNMDVAQLREAVALVAGRAQLEASGGVTLQTLRERAETGVEWISMGALTHSAPALDLSMISGGSCHEPAHGRSPTLADDHPPQAPALSLSRPRRSRRCRARCARSPPSAAR